MAVPQVLIPHKGIDTDVNELYVDSMKAVFLKNISSNADDNSRSSIKEGSNELVFTPLESNSLYCGIALPAGSNYCVGFRYFKEINQAFVCVWNSKNDHLIYRINGGDGTCQQVIKRSCLNFQLKPENFIGEGRMTIETTCRYNKITDRQENVTFLVIVDNYNRQWMIAVEDAIATNGFDGTTFPFFNTTSTDCEPCTIISLGLPPNLDCIGITPVKRTDSVAELLKSSDIGKKNWQFRIKYYDVWNRSSEHGVISEQYISALGGACIQESLGIPRCLKLKFKAGCPIVDKIDIEFRNCLGNVRGLTVSSDWYKHDTIEKYSNGPNLNWWQRTINTTSTQWTYNPSDNTIEYTFCADKECQPVPVEQTNKAASYMPLVSGSVLSLNKGIALVRNMRGFEPLESTELDKLNFTVVPPSPVSNCSAQRKIVVYGMIVNAHNQGAQFLRQANGRTIFGAADNDNTGDDFNPAYLEQILPKDQEGIIAYLAGTDYYAIGKQYTYNRFTKELKYMGPNGYDQGPYMTDFPIMKWEFESVKPGKYIFRVASHKATPSDDYQKTSTYVIGRTSLGPNGDQDPVRDPIFGQEKELLIDACDVDQTLPINTPVMIWDLSKEAKSGGSADPVFVVDGYYYEDAIEKRPIELATIRTPFYALESQTTDHNGFFFSATTHNSQWVELLSKENCTYKQRATTTKVGYDLSGSGYLHQNVYAVTIGETYNTHDRITITGKVVLCDDNTIGVAGMLVLLTRGAFAYTDAAGNFTIIAHDKQDDVTRTDYVIYSQGGSCTLLACGTGCQYCFANKTVILPACSTSTDRTVSVSNVIVRISGFNKKGPHMGGRYGVGIVMHDWLGRQSYVQMKDKHYITIPTLQETKIFDFSTINFNLTGIVFPAWVKRVSFYITENLNEDDYLTWVTDKIEFVDAAGAINTAAPTQIRVYYQSLNEYNKQNNFSTNSVWQFIKDDSSELVVTGDEVEFLANADGTFFSSNISALVKYDKVGKYIQIDYRPELKGLKQGALLRLKRAKNCVLKEFFYELCPVIKVTNGTAAVLTGTINFADAYLLSRQIPVPVEKKIQIKDADDKVTETTVIVNELRTYPFLFEHHSPSDFWGDHCWSKGRISVKNSLENQQCRKTEICVSDSLNSDGLINGLNVFDEQDTIIFNESDWSGITVALAELNTILVICENGTFITMFNDTTVSINENGQVVAPGGENRFSKPQTSNIHGCQIEDINTVRRNKRSVMFIDSINSALVLHDFSSGVDVSEIGMKSFISSNVKEIRRLRNIGERKYFHGVIDPKTNEYLLTIAKVQQIAADYINDTGEFVSGKNETVVFDIKNKVFRGNRSYTPEYFGAMDGEINDQQLICFQFGKAWIQHRLNNHGTVFNNFFGVQCTPWIEVVVNLENTKVKTFKSLEWYCKEVLFYAERVLTESGQQSRLMPLWWEKRDKFWVADFKCAVNTVVDANISIQTGANALLDGDTLVGRWLKVRMRPKQLDRGKYFELTGIIAFLEGVEKSGAK